MIHEDQDRDGWTWDTRPDQYGRTPTVYADRWCACGRAIDGNYGKCYACHKEANPDRNRDLSRSVD